MRPSKGFALTEYLLGLTFVVAVCLVPAYNNKTAPVLLMEAIKEVYACFSYTISLSRLPSVF